MSTKPPRFFAARNIERGTVLATRLETADSLWAKFMGLMGRASLEPGAGLWLPDSNGIHMMFMRFPIDAVFVGRPEAGVAEVGEVGGAGEVGGVGGAGGAGGAGWAGGARRVISVHPGLPAWTGLIPMIRGAHGVLELPVGTIAGSGTVPGDHIVLASPGG